MEKRYQVFVSSTYADLKEERQRVIQALMEMDCIPSGMELFPAADEEQWEFIKKIIDDCDYYLLIIGGRYGSTTTEGISYTEKEYDYAIERGIKVVALLHANPDDIPMGKSESDPELRGRLKAFRERVVKNRLVKFWKAADELPGLVALSLSKTIKTYPAVGWIRANQAANTQLLSEINELRKKNERLETEIAKFRQSQVAEISDLASIDDKIKVFGKYTVSSGTPLSSSYRTSTHAWELEITWKEVFALIAPYLAEYISDNDVKSKLVDVFLDLLEKGHLPGSLNDQVFQTIKIQFQALRLVKVERLSTIGGGVGVFWSLTESGRALMMSLRTVKSEQPKDS
jgi:hypothetical protein